MLLHFPQVKWILFFSCFCSKVWRSVRTKIFWRTVVYTYRAVWYVYIPTERCLSLWKMGWLSDRYYAKVHLPGAQLTRACSWSLDLFFSLNVTFLFTQSFPSCPSSVLQLHPGDPNWYWRWSYTLQSSVSIYSLFCFVCIYLFNPDKTTLFL